MSDNVRRGVAQARHNEKAAVVLGLDAIGLGGFAWWFTASWESSLVAFFATIVLFGILVPKFLPSFSLAVIMAIVWGVGAIFIMKALDTSTLGAVIVSGTVGLIAFGLHIQAFQHVADAGGQAPL